MSSSRGLYAALCRTTTRAAHSLQLKQKEIQKLLLLLLFLSSVLYIQICKGSFLQRKVLF